MGHETILLTVCFTLWLTGWLVLGRLRGVRSDGSGAEADAGRVSVIIPARNEERNLPTLLSSLTSEPFRMREVIVVDDGSTDETTAVARHYGARVVTSQPLPEGWRGKTWACHQGAEVANGEWFLFLDADTWFEREGLSRTLMLFRRFGGAFSLAPYHHVRKFHEQFSAFFNLIMHAGTGAFTCLGDRFSRRGLLGQFLLIQRIAYQRAGGHQSVKGKILENFWLAEKVRESGQQVHCLVGRHAFSFRMYPNGWRELMEGWSKGFASGAGHTPQILTFFVIGWMTGLVLAFIGIVLGGFSWPWLGLYGLCVAQVLWLLRRIGSFHVMTAVFYPAPLVFFFIVFMRSAWLAKRGGDVVWKGRKVRAG